MPATEATRKRGRRPRTHDAVLRATSELLEAVALAELSVGQILEVAKVGRTSFYEHFSSKDDVVVKLLRTVSTEVSDGIAPMLDRGGRSIEEAFREGLSNWTQITAAHRALLVAVAEEWPAIEELRRVWVELLGRVTTALAALIEADRAPALSRRTARPAVRRHNLRAAGAMPASTPRLRRRSAGSDQRFRV